MNENENEYGNTHGSTASGSEPGPSLSKEQGPGPDAGTDAGMGTGTGTDMGPGAGTGTGPPARRLERTRDGRMVAGVCSGFGDYLGVDANVLRVVLAVVTVFGGAGVLAYALAWLLIPETGRPTSILQDLINKQQRRS